MASPDSSEVPRGRKNGWMRTITVSAASIPLWRSWSKNKGPPLSWEDVARITTGSTASPARPRANTQVRTRCSDLPISTRNIGALNELDEDVLQALLLRDQGAHSHAASDQRGVHVRRGGGGGELDPEDASLLPLIRVEGRAGESGQDRTGLRIVIHVDAEPMGRRPKLRRWSVSDEPPPGQDAHAVAHGLDLPQQVARHEDGRPGVGQPSQQVADLPHPLGVQAVGRFVQHEQFRLAKEGQRDPQPLAHALAVGLDLLPGRLLQADGSQDLVDSSEATAPVFGRPPGPGEVFEVRPSREVGP